MEFINKCLVPATERLSATELLKDPFLRVENPKESTCDPLQLPNLIPRSINLMKSEPISMDIDIDHRQNSLSTCAGSSGESPRLPVMEFQTKNKNHEFRLRGNKNDDNSVALTLRIADSNGKLNFETFPFCYVIDCRSFLIIHINYTSTSRSSEEYSFYLLSRF